MGFDGFGFAQTQDLKEVIYHDGSQEHNGMVTSNAGQNLLGVLILPAWKGIDNEAKQAARDLEKEDYIAFIADICGEGNIPTETAKFSGQYKSDYISYQKRIRLALEELKKQGAEDMENLVEEMNAGKTDWQLITYVHFGHTFTNHESLEYNEVMAKRA